MTDNFDWDDQAIARLCSLWGDGHSTAEIGRRLNVSKNSVVSKAHRLNLPGRPSPIKKRDGGGMAAPKPKPQRMAKPWPSVTSSPVIPIEQVRETAAARPVTSFPGSKQCSWPHGDPRSADFHFCGDMAVPGKSYCPHHVAKSRATTLQAAMVKRWVGI